MIIAFCELTALAQFAVQQPNYVLSKAFVTAATMGGSACYLRISQVGSAHTEYYAGMFQMHITL